MTRHLAHALFLGSVALLLLAAGTAAATPPTFTVNSVFDVVADFTNDPNYDICRTNVANSVCTLRAALMNANRYAGGGVTINIPSGTYRLTIAASGADDDSTGDLNISQTMIINGASAADTVIDGNQIDRVFDVGSGATVTFSGVTIRNGLISNTGGGINTHGAMTMNDCVISNNQTSGGSSGGGIANFGTLTLTNTLVSNNIAVGNAGGIYNDNSAIMTVQGTVIRGNQTGNGGYGGGIGNAGTATLNNSTVSGNHAAGWGGAIANFFAGSVTQTNSTLNSNSADGNGGAIYNEGTVTVTDSTITANAAHRSGGGIYHAGPVELFHVTVAGNIADSDATEMGLGGGIFRATGGSGNQLWNSLFVENYAGGKPNDCGGDPATSDDYNYIQTTADGVCTINGTVTHNVTGGDALLDGLRDNGGATPTRALLAGSPAIDQIPAALCRDALGAAPIPDQRGVPRPVGPLCDIGAFEGSVPPAQFGRNLIRNGDAENGGGSLTGAFVGAPNWQSGGGQQLLTVVPYDAPGGFPSASTGLVPPATGHNFFAGGISAVALGVQDVDVSAFAPSIDAGSVVFDFSADLGGYADQDDNATVEADFLDGTGHLLTLVKLGPVTATDRGNVTGLLHRGTGDMVPAQTRTVELFLTLTRVSTVGEYNDGYADNLSLALNSTVPTPTPSPFPTGTPTLTQVSTATPTSTSTWTPTSTPTPTGTPTPSSTRTSSATPTRTPSATPTDTPTASPPSTPTATPTGTPTPTRTATTAPSLTATETPTAPVTAKLSTTPTQTPSPPSTVTAIPSSTPTVTNPQSTPTPSASPPGTSTATPTAPLHRSDANCDGRETAADMTAVVQAMGSSSPPCGADANGDGKVDAEDLLVTIGALFQ